jgi:polyhydroxyalkanoate synthesis regulator phasin
LEVKFQHCDLLQREFRHFLKEVYAAKTQIGEKPTGVVVEQLSTDLSKLRREVLTQKGKVTALPRDIVALQNKFTQDEWTCDLIYRNKHDM